MSVCKAERGRESVCERERGKDELTWQARFTQTMLDETRVWIGRLKINVSKAAGSMTSYLVTYLMCQNGQNITTKCDI